MTPQQRLLVQSSFQRIVPVQAAAARLFYDRLFELDPALRPLFKSDMREQNRKLMAMIGMAVEGLDQPDLLLPALRELGRRHFDYGVQDAHYATTGAALFWMLETVLGGDFTPPLREAWMACYQMLGSAMREGARRCAA